MKSKITRALSLLLVLCITLSCVLLLSGCEVLESATIKKTKINEDGELIIYYTDGTKENVGKVVGEDGKDGADGADGAPGEKGDKGSQGLPGLPGKDGVDGVDGVDGKDGSVIISGEGADVSLAIAKGLRSTVSIISNFTETSKTTIGSEPLVNEYSSAGAGVIYKLDRESRSAFIITNYHVVFDPDSDAENGISPDINVYLYGSEYLDMGIPATYVGGSMNYDIAVLYVEDSDFLMNSFAIEATLSDSDLVHLGDRAIAIGNAEGYGLSATLGTVNVESEYIDMTGADNVTEVVFRVMRVDAAVNHGNSGGGLYNDQGELVGIVNAKIVSEDVDNIGYAIPVDLATAVADNIIRNCHGTDCECVRKATVGLMVSTKESIGEYDPETGLITIKETVGVEEVVSGSLSEGNFEVGDVFVSATLKGETVMITRRHHLIDLILNADAGDVIEYKVIRADSEVSVFITVSEEAINDYN